MSREQLSRVTRYGFAVLTPFLALGLSLSLQPVINRGLLIFFFFAVILSANYSGMVGSVISAILSILLANYFIFSPVNQFSLTPQDLFVSVIFLVTAILSGGMYEQRRRAEKSAFKDRESLRTTLTSIGDGVIATDKHGTITAFNPTAEQLTGWTQQEAIGKPVATVFRIVNEETRREVENPLRQVFIEGKVVGLANHTVLICKDGRELPIDDSAAPIRDAKGTITGGVLVFHDISERHAAERRLRDSEQRFRTVSNTAPVLIWMADANGTYTFFNTPWLQFTGRTMEQELGSGWMENIHPDDLPYSQTTYQKGLSTRQSFTMEYRMRRADGQYRWVVDTGIPQFAPDGTFEGFIGSCIDIDDLKHAQERQRFLLAANTTLTASLDYETTLQNIAKIAVPQIADWCAIHILQDDGIVKPLAIAHNDPEKVRWIMDLQKDYAPDPQSQTGVYQVLRSGKPELYPYIPDSLLDRVARNEEHRQILRTIGYSSAMIVPMKVGGKTFGTMTFVAAESRQHYDQSDLELAQELAYHSALTVENVRLYGQAQHERERLHVTLTSIGDAVITTDNQGRITLMNAVAESLTGWTQDDARGVPLENVFCIVNEDTRAAVESPVSKVLREGKIVGLANHTVLIAKNGSEVPIDDSGAPIKDDTGNIVGVVLVFRDITERKQQEVETARLMVELKETSARTIALQEVTAALSSAVTISDVAQVFNDIAVKAVGATAGGVVRLIHEDTLEVIEAANYTPETVQNWQRFSINEPAPLAQSVRDSTPVWLKSPEEWRTQYERPSTTGHIAWATLPLVVKDRTIGGLGFSFSDEQAFSTDDRRFMVALANQYAQALDRTLIYEAEQAARNDAERAKQRVEFLNQVSQLLASSLDFDTTFHNIRALILPDMADIYAIDIVQPDTSVRRVAMGAANPEIADLVAELEKMSDSTILLNSATFRAGQAILYPVIPPALFESIARDADHLAVLRKLDVASEIIVPLRVRETNIGILTLVRHSHHSAYTEDDVVMVEELAHRAAQALENARLYVESQQAINLRDEFLSVAAHELKTPVTSMRGFAQLLLRRTTRNTTTTPEELKHALGQIDQQAIKLTRLIGHLLDVSRIESGRLVIEKEAMDLAKLARETVETMQRTTETHTISIEAPSETNILADTLRLEQVLVNLLDNAVKFTPNGGAIHVQVTTPDPDSLTISVTDTGLGIPPERRANLFDRFYQAHSEGYKGGMGLGLYISNQIISLHGGKIQPEFPEEGGTRFVITLPVK